MRCYGRRINNRDHILNIGRAIGNIRTLVGDAYDPFTIHFHWNDRAPPCVQGEFSLPLRSKFKICIIS